VDTSAIVVVVTGYLIGSIDFGVVLPRLFGVDIYSAGSGNPGASNVLRTMGRGAAAAVMLGDIGKGLAAAAIGATVVSEPAGFAAGFAAVVGHCFPIWHRFRGGKGVAAAAGMTLWLEPLLGVALLVAWGVLVGITKRASIASLVIITAYVPLLAVFEHLRWSLVWAGLASVLVIVRHHENIRRLLGGAENTVEAAG